MSTLEIPVLIARKRDGGTLAPRGLLAFVAAYVAGDVDDAQMAAFLMAGVIRGFSREEAVTLTEALLDSGDRIDLRGLRGPTVDKHSTGGVGDTTTLVVASAARRGRLPGRQAVGPRARPHRRDPGQARGDPGLAGRPDAPSRSTTRSSASAWPSRRRRRTGAGRQARCTPCATSRARSPAPALIASSVMSKKLAGGAAARPARRQGRRRRVHGDRSRPPSTSPGCASRSATAHGRRTGALVTDMSQPLGDADRQRARGRGRDRGPAGRSRADALRELSRRTGGRRCWSSPGAPPDEPRAEIERLLDAGAALEAFRDVRGGAGRRSGGRRPPWEVLPAAPVVLELGPGAGIVTGFACRRLGELAARARGRSAAPGRHARPRRRARGAAADR